MGGRGKPPHFDRLRWWVGWHGGSRGEVWRVRAKSEVPVVVGMEEGEGQMARELARRAPVPLVVGA
jgi:hypothetical protein